MTAAPAPAPEPPARGSSGAAATATGAATGAHGAAATATGTGTGATGRAAGPSATLRDRLPLLLLLGAGLVFVVLALYLGRGRTFFFDEWDFVLRRTEGGSMSAGLDAYMTPHNEHWSLLLVLVYKLGFSVFGLGTTVPYRLLVAVLYAVAAGLVWALARRRIGPWAALVPALAVMYMGAGYENMLWGMELGYVGTVCLGLGALLLVERESPRSDAGACVLLVLAVMTQGTFVPFLVCVFVVLALARDWSRMWIVVVPVAVYGIWYIAYYEGSTLGSHTVDAVQWAVDAAAASVGGLLGDGSNAYGRPALLGAIALVVWHVVRSPSPVTRRFWGLLIGAGVFWLLVGRQRATVVDPASSRYLGLAAFLVALLLVEVFARFRGAWGRREFLVGVTLLAIAVGAGLPELRNGAKGYRETSDVVRAELAVVELLAAPLANSELQPDPNRAPQIFAGMYLRARSVHGGDSPALPAAELPRAGSTAREEADRVLFATGVLAPAPAPGRRPPETSRCRPAAAGSTAELAVPPGGALWVRAVEPASVVFRRFGDTAKQPPIAQLQPRQAVIVRPPADASPSPYLFATNVPAEICTT